MFVLLLALRFWLLWIACRLGVCDRKGIEYTSDGEEALISICGMKACGAFGYNQPLISLTERAGEDAQQRSLRGRTWKWSVGRGQCRRCGRETWWRGESGISMNKRQQAVRGVMTEGSRWHAGLNKSAFMPQSWATCEAAVTKLEPTGLNWGRWQVLNGFLKSYLTPGKYPETSLEGPKRGFPNWAGPALYAIFSTTIIQQHPALILAFYISRPVFYFVSTLLILFPSLVEQVSRLIRVCSSQVGADPSVSSLPA